MEDFGGGEDYLLDQQVDEPMFSAGLDLQKKENFLASQMNLDNLGLTQQEGNHEYDAAMSS